MSHELLLLLLFAAAFVAGLIDSIAGGGGLITVPVLLGIGLPPQVALGTNKLQASFGSGSAMLHFIRSGAVKFSDCWQGIAWTALGSGTGFMAVQLLDPALLRRIIPWLLAGIAIYTLATPKLGIEDRHARLSPSSFYLIFGVTIGFYDGFLGPGTGSFWFMAFILLMGHSMMRATATTKVMNFTSNVVALFFFLIAGQVHFLEGIIMGIGQFMGARIGAKLVITKGVGLIRPIFITMVLALLARLVWQSR